MNTPDTVITPTTPMTAPVSTNTSFYFILAMIFLVSTPCHDIT
jgi:hypothetical protein